MKRVSVVIPLFNKAHVVKRALDSVLSQTATEMDVIVVDDGSTDGGGEIVRQCGDRRVRVVKQENGGPGVARNRGLSEVETELVAFLDADDEWLPTFLEESLGLFERYGSEAPIVCSDSTVFNSGALLLPEQQRAGLREGVLKVSPEMPWEDAVALLLYLQWWKTVSRADCLRAWGGFFDRERGTYSGGEDMWLSLKVVLNEPIAISLKPLHKYHSEDSELASHAVARRASLRPVVPFLLYPEEIEAVCAAPLREHLRHMLAPFALGTANYLGFHRRFAQGREILNRFDCRRLTPASDYVGAWLRTSSILSGPLDAGRTLRRWMSGDPC